MKKYISLSLMLAMLFGLAVVFTGIPVMAEEPTNTLIEADTSWYDANEDASVFFISDAADLLGLSVLSFERGISFGDKTIELTADIDLNPGWSAAVTVDADTKQVTVPEVPLNFYEGVSTFAGTFDGRGHSISGLYMKLDMSQMSSGKHFGFFYATVGNAAVKNLVISNSLLYSISTTGAMGGGKGIGALIGCVANGTCTVDNVYVDAEIVHVKQSSTNHSMIGGIIGRIDNSDKPVLNSDGTVTYAVNVSNAVFAGRIITVDSDMKAGQSVLNTAQICAGGQLNNITGTVSGEEVEIKNCPRAIYTNCVAIGEIISGTPETYGEGKNKFVNLIERALPKETVMSSDAVKTTDSANCPGKRPNFVPLASYDEELAKNFVFSDIANAIVPSAVADMLDPQKPAMPNDPSYDPNGTTPPDNGNDTDTQGGAETQKPPVVTQKTSVTGTDAPETDGSVGGDSGSGSGCGSVASTIVVGILAIAAIPALCIRKKKD